MKTFAMKASLLALTLGLVVPHDALGDDGLVTVEHGIAPVDPYANANESSEYMGSSDVRNPERRHQMYLQSRTGGHAEYTHRWNLYHANQMPWHGGYYNARWGRPLALLVPPTADTQTSWGWGVNATDIRPIHHQFSRGNPAAYPPGSWSRFRPTPYWPTHTDQFGVYYVRGPW